MIALVTIFEEFLDDSQLRPSDSSDSENMLQCLHYLQYVSYTNSIYTCLHVSMTNLHPYFS